MPVENPTPAPDSAGIAPPRRRRLRRVALSLTLIAALLAGGLALIWRVLPDAGLDLLGLQSCTATTPDGEVQLDLEQAANAATISAVGQRLGVGERGVAIGLATALQESKLLNLDYGDRDSLGLFQQRPSQGWGTPVQVRDPVYTATRFFQALKRVPGYERLPLTEAAQAVQRSEFPDAYAQHEPDATVLAAALTGRVPRGLTCRVRRDDIGGQTEQANGLTPRTEKLRREMERVFGPLSLGGFAPGGVTTGHMAGSAHYDGRAIDVFFRPVTDAERRKGWALAQWLVAHAADLGVATVIYDDAIWSAGGSSAGWRPYTPPGGPAQDEGAPTAAPSGRDAVRRHLDHVHVDVLG